MSGMKSNGGRKEKDACETTLFTHHLERRMGKKRGNKGGEGQKDLEEASPSATPTTPATPATSSLTPVSPSPQTAEQQQKVDSHTSVDAQVSLTSEGEGEGEQGDVAVTQDGQLTESTEPQGMIALSLKMPSDLRRTLGVLLT